MSGSRPKYYQRRVKYLPDPELPGEMNEALLQFAGNSQASLKRLKVLMELLVQRQRVELQQLPVLSLSSDETARHATFRTGVIYGLTTVQRFAEEAIDGTLDPHKYPDLGFETAPLKPMSEPDDEDEWEDEV